MIVWKTGLEYLADLKDNKTEDNKTSELFAKWGKPPRELKYNPASQPDYYIKRWDEQDREKQEAKNRQMQIDFEQTVKLLEPPSKDSLAKAEPVIKSLPTYYNGIKFRSRLEARWAIFFDELGFSWEYEPEGFKLENGVRYLPDFLIKNFKGRFNGDLWIEVKGDLTNCDWDKLENFAYGDREKDELGNTKIKRPLLVLNNLFYRTGSAKNDDYTDRICDTGFNGDGNICTFYYIDGDVSWPCILGVNEEGQGELFGPDGYYDYRSGADIPRMQKAFEKACNAQFDRDGKLLR